MRLPDETTRIFYYSEPLYWCLRVRPKRICLGCFRSRDERRYWNECPIEVKHKIVLACGQRKRRHELKQRKAQLQQTPIQGSLLDKDAQGNLFDDE